MTKIAILDDYQNVAMQTADWSAVQARADVIVFYDHVADADALVARLEAFEAILTPLWRAREPVAAARLSRLRCLSLLPQSRSRPRWKHFAPEDGRRLSAAT